MNYDNVSVQKAFRNRPTEETKPNKSKQLECGPMPNVMAALPTTGGALCSTPQFG